MKFIQHYSSSRSNLYEVRSKGGDPHAPRLLLECGVRWPLLLKAIDYELKSVQACLLTHEHMDHAKSALDLMKNGIDVYASAGTLKELGIINHRRNKLLPPYCGLTNKIFDCYAFPVIHDAAEPFGFVIREVKSNEYLLFCPDSGFVKQRFNIKFSIIALECSYDPEILRKNVKDGKVHLEVAKRIMRSHASKDTTLKYLQKYCDLSKCREIHLLHCSGMNLDKRKTQKEFDKKLYLKTVICKR